MADQHAPMADSIHRRERTYLLREGHFFGGMLALTIFHLGGSGWATAWLVVVSSLWLWSLTHQNDGAPS